MFRIELIDNISIIIDKHTYKNSIFFTFHPITKFKGLPFITSFVKSLNLKN